MSPGPLPRAAGAWHCSLAVLCACPSPAKGTVAPLGVMGSGTQHTAKPMVTPVSPTRTAGSYSPAAEGISQLAGCLSAAGLHSCAGETSAGKELSSATGSPWAALEVKTAPGDPSHCPVLRRASRAQPRPQGVRGAEWDDTPETTLSPNPYLPDAASRLFDHQLIHHGLQADAQHNGLQERRVTRLHAPPQLS